LAQLVFEAPTRQTPGYPRRMRRALELREQLQAEPGPELVDTIIEFLLPYVTEPADREAAIEALWDASEAQFEEMLAAVQGGNPADPPA